MRRALTTLLLFWGLLLVACGSRRPPVRSDDQKCANDGYFKNGTCQCKPYFYGERCTYRKCLNGGFHSTFPSGYPGENRCICPQGFLGQHCEPQRCLPGADSLQTFSRATERQSVSVLFTWNADLVSKIKTSNDDFTTTICGLFDSDGVSVVNLRVPGSGSQVNKETKKACQDGMDILTEDCESCEVDFVSGEDLLTAVASSLPQSTVFIVTNVGFNGTDVLPRIRKQATALKITINTLLFAPPGVNFDSVYTSEAYQPYADLAADTGGVYVTPYQASSQQLLGTTTVSKAIPMLLKHQADNYPIHLSVLSEFTTLYSASNKIRFQYRDGTVDATQLTLVSDGNLQDLKPPILDTGYFKIFEWDMGAVSRTTHLTGFQNTTNVWVYGVPSFPVGLAVSGALEVDASHPHAVPIGKTAVGPNLLVGAGGEKATSLNPETLTLDISTVTRKDKGQCQYASVLATIKQCKPDSLTWVKIEANAGADVTSTVRVPLFCGAPADASVEYETEEEEGAEPLGTYLDVDEICLVPSASQKYMKTGRSTTLGLMFDLKNKEMLQDIFTNPGNVFEKIQKMIDAKQIDTAILNIVGKQNNTKATNNLADRFADLIDFVLNEIEADSTLSDVDWYAAIDALIDAAPNATFYDLIVVSGSNFIANLPSFEQQFSLLKRVYGHRIRIHWLSVNNDDHTVSTGRYISATTGGIHQSFDDGKAVAEFISNIDFFFANELVASQELVQFLPPFVQKLTLSAAETIHIIINGEQPGDGTVRINNGQPITPSFTTSTLTVYDFTADTTGTVTLNIMYLVLSGPVSLRIYSERSSNISLAFAARTPNAPDIYGPEYNYRKSAQIPVIRTASAGKAFTIFQQTNSTINKESVNTGGVALSEQSASCPYNLLFNFNWMCSKPTQLYFVQVDVEDATRTFPFVCNAESNSTTSCVHGEAFGDGCACGPGWTGALCTEPLCLNGGTALSGGTCDCPEDTTGYFCEMFNNVTCSPQEASPEFKSRIGTLVLVVETTKTVKDTMDEWITSLAIARNSLANNFGSAQIVLVAYGDGFLEQRVATSDPKLLGRQLQYYLNFDKNANSSMAALALMAGLQLQTTDKSLLVWVSESDVDIPSVDPALVKLMTEKRAELRIFTASENTGLTNLTALSMIATAVPLQLAKNNFSVVASQYIYKTLPKVGSVGRNLHVLEYGNQCPETSVSVNIYIPPSSEVFIFSTGLNVAIDDSAQLTTIIHGLQTFKLDAADGGKTLKFTFTKTTGACSFSIEAVNDEQVGVGLATDVFSQAALAHAAASQVDNWLNIHWMGAIDRSDKTGYEAVNDYQNAQFWTVAANFSVDTSIPGAYAAASLQNTFDQSCTYEFLPKLPDCGDNKGFLTKILAKDDSKDRNVLQKVFFTPCVDPTADCGDHGSLYPGVCACENGWIGFDCRRPICENGGTPDGQVCNCPSGTYGVRCEVPPPGPNAKRMMLFILDASKTQTEEGMVLATDIQQMRDAVIETLKLYDFNTTSVVLATTNYGVTYDPNNLTNVTSILDRFGGIDKPARLQQYLENILEDYSNLKVEKEGVYDYKTAFFLTNREGINATQGTGFFADLRRDFNIETLVSGFGVPVDTLSSWGDTTTVSSVHDFVVKAVDFNRGSPIPLPTTTTTTTTSTTTTTTTARIPYCTESAKADILLMLDDSGDEEYTQQVYTIFTYFYQQLTVSPELTATCNKNTGVPTNMTTLDEFVTRVTAMVYFNYTYLQRPVTFCDQKSNDNAGKDFCTSSGKAKAITNMTSIVDAAHLLSTTERYCNCRRIQEAGRYTGTPAAQLMIWIPNKATYLPSQPSINLKSKLPQYNQYLLPLKFKIADTAEDTIWKQMEEIPLRNATDHASVVEDMWSFLCKATKQDGPIPRNPGLLLSCKNSMFWSVEDDVDGQPGELFPEDGSENGVERSEEDSNFS